MDPKRVLEAFRLEGKVALVTGASRGLGRAIALGLAEMGVAITVNYASREDAAREVVELIQSRGGAAIAVDATGRRWRACCLQWRNREALFANPAELRHFLGLLGDRWPR